MKMNRSLVVLAVVTVAVGFTQATSPIADSGKCPADSNFFKNSNQTAELCARLSTTGGVSYANVLYGVKRIINGYNPDVTAVDAVQLTDSEKAIAASAYHCYQLALAGSMRAMSAISYDCAVNDRDNLKTCIFSRLQALPACAPLFMTNNQRDKRDISSFEGKELEIMISGLRYF